jgi:hypothetical protein
MTSDIISEDPEKVFKTPTPSPCLSPLKSQTSVSVDGRTFLIICFNSHAVVNRPREQSTLYKLSKSLSCYCYKHSKRFTMVCPALAAPPSRPSRVAALKQATKDSLRHLMDDSTRSLDLETSPKDDYRQYQQLVSCIETHKLRELSNERLFQVKRYVPRKKKSDENAGKICIACTRPECFHKIFIRETGMEDTPQNWLLEETRIMDELQQHETKHYVTFAKIFLWLLEALMVMIINYYKV